MALDRIRGLLPTAGVPLPLEMDASGYVCELVPFLVSLRSCSHWRREPWASHHNTPGSFSTFFMTLVPLGCFLHVCYLGFLQEENCLCHQMVLTAPTEAFWMVFSLSSRQIQ